MSVRHVSVRHVSGRAAGIDTPLFDPCRALYRETVALEHRAADTAAVVRELDEPTPSQ